MFIYQRFDVQRFGLLMQAVLRESGSTLDIIYRQQGDCWVTMECVEQCQ